MTPFGGAVLDCGLLHDLAGEVQELTVRGLTHDFIREQPRCVVLSGFGVFLHCVVPFLADPACSGHQSVRITKYVFVDTWNISTLSMYVISRVSATFQREYIIALMLIFVNVIYESNDVQQSTKITILVAKTTHHLSHHHKFVHR